MEEYLRSCLKNSEEEQMRKSSAEQLLLLQGLKPQNCSALQENNKQNSRSDNNQGVSPHLPCHSSWLTHTQTQSARFPTNMPHQPQGSSLDLSSHLPPSPILPHFNQFHHLAPMLAHLPLWPRQDQPGWASLQSDNPLSWTAGATGIPSAFEALWGQLHMDEPPHERLVEAETRRAPRETGGESRSSHCSQELDINPVRLSSGQAESSESGRDSSQSSREKWKKREKRGKAKRTSSDRERCSSQGSSQTSSAIVIAGVTVVQSDASCGNSRTSGGQRTKRRSGGLAVGSPQIEKVANDMTKSEGEDSESHKEESHSTGEESGSQREDSTSKDAENQRPVDKSDREEESESDSVKIENGDAEKEMQESNSGAEQNSEEEMDEEEEEHKNDLGDGEEKKKSQRDEEKDVRHVDDDDDDDDVSGRKNTTEEEQTEAEEELEDQGDDEDRIKDEDGEKRKQGSASSQDEEEDERVENKVCEVEEGSDEEEDGEGEEEEEEEQRSDEAGEEESDSDDSIISPQENRLKKIHIIPEEAAEDDDDDDKSGSKTGSSDRDEFSENDIENLLAPQQQTKKTDKDLKVDDKAKATCDYVEIFQVEDNSKKTDQQSDSDELDDFYD
ncbi:protein starmaker [Hippoglossus hippoglossus]|uniref:protein starmaker n=1 Tax=Hippoglossus hippoglossus TaxID=8267 RepID=UPI00148DAE38|nr:protein starmaker [Hippoglossus hippoglossus]